MDANSEGDCIKIMFASAEAHPFYKIGGLGDYSGSLPNALQSISSKNNRYMDVRVFLPLHDPATIKKYSLYQHSAFSLNSKSGKAHGRVFTTELNRVMYYFIQQISPKINSTNVYVPNEHENSLKYIFFSLACIKMLEQIDWQPDIVHANDWHSALIIHQLKNSKTMSQVNKKIQTILAIHNMPFMGTANDSIFHEFMIDPTIDPAMPKWALNLPLPMGIVAADKIVAVSPTYAEELKTNYYAYGIENYFIKHADKLIGIINGINTDHWNPSTDSNLLHNYSFDSIQKRTHNKADLTKKLGLDQNLDNPLLVVISRLENQKGIDILLDGLLSIENLNWKAVILGTGHHGYEHAFRALERENPQKIKAMLEYNSVLASQLYASGDMILMPSLYEPCGLSQMIAMRYGCIPIAHAVGGLKDSIITKPESSRTGFLFNKPDPTKFIACLKKAFAMYEKPSTWKQIQANAMLTDNSWKISAEKYANLYDELCSC